MIVAALSLVDLRDVARYEVRRAPASLSLTATVGVIVLGVLQGIVIAIVLAVPCSSGAAGGRTARCSARAGLEGGTAWSSLDAAEVPGVVVYRWEAPLFFANAGQFRQQIRQLVRERQPRWVVLQCEAMTDIDVTAAECSDSSTRSSTRRGPRGLRRDADPLQDLVQRYGLEVRWNATTATRASTRRSRRSPPRPGDDPGRADEGPPSG